MYLIWVVFWSIQVLFCLDFYSQLIWVVFLQSGFSLILSWSLPHLVRVLFWSIWVLSDLVLVLAAPCRGSFFINPGSFWSCLGSCRILSGFFFDQSGFFLKLSCYLQHLFRVVFWLFRVLSELVCSSSGLFSDQSGFFLNLSWYLQHLFGVVCASSRFFLNLYVPHPGCFLINPGSFWICLGTCSTSSGLFALRPGSFWICMYLIRVVFWSIRVVSGLALRSVFSWSHGTDVAPLHVKHKNML